MKLEKIRRKFFLGILYYYAIGAICSIIFQRKFFLYNEIAGGVAFSLLAIKILYHKLIGDMIESTIENINRDPNYFWKKNINLKAVDGKCKYKHKNLDICNNVTLEKEEYCFWHLPDKKKYSRDFILRVFKKNKSFKELFVEHIKKNKDISGYYLMGAELENISFTSMLMRDVDLTSANLKNSNWENTNLSYSKLSYANLSESSFKNVNFLDTLLFNTKTRNVRFENVTNLTKENFVGICYKIVPKAQLLEAYPVQAKESYKALLNHFIKNNMLEDASWAAFKERQMTRKYLLIKAMRFIPDDNSLVHHNGFIYIIHVIINKLNLITRVVWMHVFEIIFGYGESLKRLALSCITAILTYSFLFYKYKMLPFEDYKNNLYFSLCNFFNVGYGEVVPKDTYKLFAVSETILGIVFLGLLFVVLIRKIVGRN